MPHTAISQKAHNALRRAIHRGEIVRGTVCETCGTTRWKPGLIHAHHDDYSKPLDVRWLCGSCHKKHHVALRKAAGTYTNGRPRKRSAEQASA